MTRPVSSPPQGALTDGRRAPSRSRATASRASAWLPALASVLALAVMLAACVPDPRRSDEPTPTASGPTSVPTSEPTSEPTAQPTVGPTGEPTDEPTTAPTVAPTTEPTGQPTDEPTDGPSASPSSEPSPTSAGGPAGACTGTDANRDFFAAVAEAVDWPVYCPVLPRGWFVESGSYRLAGGGRVDISYRGPGSARLELQQGVVCGDGCPPAGSDKGDARLADRSGTLIDRGDGRYSIVVDPDAGVSWVLTTQNLAEADVRTVAADLARVAG